MARGAMATVIPSVAHALELRHTREQGRAEGLLDRERSLTSVLACGSADGGGVEWHGGWLWG